MKKPYWIWYWSNTENIEYPTDIKDFRIFFDFDEMKTYSAEHGFLNRHLSGYWSSYDKVK